MIHSANLVLCPKITCLEIIILRHSSGKTDYCVGDYTILIPNLHNSVYRLQRQRVPSDRAKYANINVLRPKLLHVR